MGERGGRGRGVPDRHRGAQDDHGQLVDPGAEQDIGPAGLPGLDAAGRAGGHH